MQETKRKAIESKNKHLWFRGSPLVLCSMLLELDEQTNKLCASAKFLNVQPEPVKEITVDIICYNLVRAPIDSVLDYTYMGFNVKRNEEFGLSISIPIENIETRNIEFVLKSVTTVNNEVWYNENNERFNIDLQQKDIFSEQGEHNKEFRDICVENNIDPSFLIYKPVFDEYHWMCSCGCLNWNDELKCSGCGIDSEWLKNNLSEQAFEKRERLKELERKRIRDEEEKRRNVERAHQKAEFEQRRQGYQKQIKKQKSSRVLKYIITAVIIVLLLAGAAFGAVSFLIPYINYSSAKLSMDSGLYDAAIEKLSSMSNFLDSDELLNEATYDKAAQLYDYGMRDEAAELYFTIADYSDSYTKYREIEYELAGELYDEEDYKSAAEKYKLISGYLDSDELLEKCREIIYNGAVEKLNGNQISEAYEDFEYLGDYEDSEDMLKECIYVSAQKYYEKLSYSEALEEYNRIPEYKDVPEILASLKYLSYIISATSDADSPAVWNSEGMRCGVCNDEDSATYTLTFGIDGAYYFEIACENHTAVVAELSGRYKIEGDTVYFAEYEQGKMVWTEALKILSIERVENNVDGKNAVMVITNPFDASKEIMVYGNIISDDNIVF